MRISYEKQNSPHHPRPHCLTWMHPGRYYNSSFSLHNLKISFFCDCQNFAIYSCQSFAECLPGANGPSFWIRFNFLYILVEVRVGVRVAIGEIYCVIVVKELVTERGSIVAFAGVTDIFLNSVSII